MMMCRRKYKRRQQFQLTRSDFLRALQIQNEKIELSESKVLALKEELNQERQLRKRLEEQVAQLLLRFEQFSAEKDKPSPQPPVDNPTPQISE